MSKWIVAEWLIIIRYIGAIGGLLTIVFEVVIGVEHPIYIMKLTLFAIVFVIVCNILIELNWRRNGK